MTVGHAFLFAAVVCGTCASQSLGYQETELRSLLANDVAAGAACSLNEICTSGSPPELCPVDIHTEVGVCPDVPAGQQCNPGDMCATSATTSAACPAQPGDVVQCPDLPPGATCSAFVGDCGGNQSCNARVTEAEDADSTNNIVGVCIDLTAAGSPCTVGYGTSTEAGDAGLCSGASTFAGYFCSSGSCPLARPGATCSSASPEDMCSTGSGTASTACPPIAEGEGISECPPVATDASCLAGDECSDPQVCNAVGQAQGTCVNPKRAGAPCDSTSSPPDMCVVNGADLNGDQAQIGAVCNSSTCPFASAGGVCNYTLGDLCSDGTSSGTLCPEPEGQSSECPALPPNAVCHAGDDCVIGNTDQFFLISQACNAVGSAPGLCVNLTAAGGICTPSYDVCSPNYVVCTTGTCPLADAGEECSADDLCSSGTAGGSLCPEGGEDWCPYLATGLACTATDTCVWGSLCVGAKDDGSASGICTPIVKGTATRAQVVGQMTQSGTSENAAAPVCSNATVVPAVTSVALLGGYSTVAAFNTSERARFVDTLETNVFDIIGSVVNVTITNVVLGSISVSNTIAFTSADAAAAAAGQADLTQKLSSEAVSFFGTTFGSVAVSDVQIANATNPTYSGASSVGVAVWTLALVVAAAAVSI